MPFSASQGALGQPGFVWPGTGAPWAASVWGMGVWCVLLALLGACCALSPWHALLFFGAALFVVAGAVHPVLAGALLVLLTPVHREPLGLKVLPFTYELLMVNLYAKVPLFLPVALGAAVSLPAILSRRHWSELAVTLPLVLALTYAAISLLWTPDLVYSVLCLVFMASSVVVFLTMYTAVDTPRLARLFIYLFIAAMLLQAVFAILTFLGESEVVQKDWPLFGGVSLNLSMPTGRYSGQNIFRRASGLAHHNILGSYMNLGTVLILGLLTVERRWWLRIGLFCAMIVLVFVMLATMSRAGVGILVGVSFLFFLFSKRVRPLFVVLYPAFIGFVALLFLAQNASIELMMGQEFSPRVVQRTQQSDDLGNVAPERTRIWGDGIGALLRSNLAGAGIGTVHDFSNADGAFYAHSLYFSYLFELGVAGLLLFLVFCLYFLSRYLALLPHQESFVQRMNPAFCSGLCGILVHGVVDYDYLDMHIWLFLGLALAVLGLSRSELKQATSQPTA